MTNDSEPLDKLNHVAIEATFVNDAVQWYLSNIRCKTEYPDATWPLLRFDNVRLALVSPGEHPPHLGFAVEESAL